MILYVDRFLPFLLIYVIMLDALILLILLRGGVYNLYNLDALYLCVYFFKLRLKGKKKKILNFVALLTMNYVGDITYVSYKVFAMIAVLLWYIKPNQLLPICIF